MKPIVHTTREDFRIGIRVENHVHILAIDNSLESAELLAIILAGNLPWFKLSYEATADIIAFFALWLIQINMAPQDK